MATQKKREAKIKTDRNGMTFAAIDDIEVEEGFNLRGNAVADEELVSRVTSLGVINPIHVRRKGKALHLVDGARRLDAARKAGLGSVPVAHHGALGDDDALILSVAANENQKKLTRKQKVESFKRLRRTGMSAAEIAKRMGVDRRTVDEALRVEKHAVREMKEATKKPAKEGGVPARVAARASTLPKKEQRKLVNKVAGKSAAAGLKEVRNTEIKLGKKTVGRKPVQEKVKASGYSIAPDATERCKALEDAIHRRMKNGTTKVLNAQLNIIECIKGNMKPSDVFGWDNI